MTGCHEAPSVCFAVLSELPTNETQEFKVRLHSPIEDELSLTAEFESLEHWLDLNA